MPDKTMPRGKLHHTIRHIFSGTIAAYYKKYPEMLKDPNFDENTDLMMKLMLAVLDAVDEFEIKDKGTK